MTCKFLRTSTRFRTAVTSLVVGFLSAVVLVEAVSLAGEWLSTITNRVYVDGDPERIVDDGFQIARHLMDDWETKFQRLQRAAGQDRISAGKDISLTDFRRVSIHCIEFSLCKKG